MELLRVLHNEWRRVTEDDHAASALLVQRAVDDAIASLASRLERGAFSSIVDLREAAGAAEDAVFGNPTLGRARRDAEVMGRCDSAVSNLMERATLRFRLDDAARTMAEEELQWKRTLEKMDKRVRRLQDKGDELQQRLNAEHRAFEAAAAVRAGAGGVKCAWAGESEAHPLALQSSERKQKQSSATAGSKRRLPLTSAR